VDELARKSRPTASLRQLLGEPTVESIRETGTTENLRQRLAEAGQTIKKQRRWLADAQDMILTLNDEVETLESLFAAAARGYLVDYKGETN